MSHTAIPAQLSIKYWHDKTINTAGLWRLLPLAGLTVAAACTASYYVAVALISVIKRFMEHQRQAAAIEAFRAAAEPEPPVEQSKPGSSWVDALLEGIDESVDTNHSRPYSPCTFDSTARYHRDCGVYGEDVADSIHCR